MQTPLARLYAPSDRSVYLAAFRVYLALHLFCLLLSAWGSLGVLYGSESFVVRGDTRLSSIMYVLAAHYQLVLGVYVVLLVLYALGIGKHFTALSVYVAVEVLHRLQLASEDGGQHLIEFLLLYMACCNSYEYLSMSKLKIRSKTLRKISNMMTNLGVVSIVGHLCLVYFVSGIYKAHADIWFSGTATYYTMTLERFAGTRFNVDLVQNGYFVVLSTYVTLLFELSFPFIVWYKRLRPFVLTVGMLLHLGIYIFMMIHSMQLLFIMTYGFFFADEQYRQGWAKLNAWLLRRRVVNVTRAV